MKFPWVQRRVMALLAVVVPLAALFLYVAVYYGPLASVPVTTTMVENRAIAPALFGVGTVQARFTQRIGPIFTGRLLQLNVDVGDMVIADQVLGEMDPVDLVERIAAQRAAIRSTEAAVRQARVRRDFAAGQVERYEKLLPVRGVSQESVDIKRQELAVADAELESAQENGGRLRAELEALRAQLGNLKLISPGDGMVIARNADPGTTVTAGRPVLEIVDPSILWVDARFDQGSTQGLSAGLSAQIVLRSWRQQGRPGKVIRVEPLADVVTEETLAKIAFQTPPDPVPPVGELAEVTVQLPEMAAAPTIPNAAIRTVDGQIGVWKLDEGRLIFAPLTLGRFDLNGFVQVEAGLEQGDRIVVYSEKALTARSRVNVVDRIAGGKP